MTEANTVLVERDGPVTIVSINRPHCRNAVDGATARKLYDAFLAFDSDEAASVAVFTGTGGYFCAGADLKAVASGDPNKKREVGGHNSIAPMGPSRLRLSKPVIAAVEGPAVRPTPMPMKARPANSQSTSGASANSRVPKSEAPTPHRIAARRPT